MVYEKLKTYELTGVTMYILGLGQRAIFPRLCDDPALHRYTTVNKGNGFRTCLTCMHSAAKDGVFDPAKKVLRDIELTKHCLP